jgi:hypothetical protein
MWRTSAISPPVARLPDIGAALLPKAACVDPEIPSRTR